MVPLAVSRSANTLSYWKHRGNRNARHGPSALLRAILRPTTLELRPDFPAAVLPGGHAKWVRSPRGAATVCGEPHPLPARPGRHCASKTAHGKARDARDDPRARIPGRRPVFRLRSAPDGLPRQASRENTPRRVPVRTPFVRSFCLSILTGLAGRDCDSQAPSKDASSTQQGQRAGRQRHRSRTCVDCRNYSTDTRGVFTVTVPDEGRLRGPRGARRLWRPARQVEGTPAHATSAT